MNSNNDDYLYDIVQRLHGVVEGDMSFAVTKASRRDDEWSVTVHRAGGKDNPLRELETICSRLHDYTSDTGFLVLEARRISVREFTGWNLLLKLYEKAGQEKAEDEEVSPEVQEVIEEDNIDEND